MDLKRARDVLEVEAAALRAVSERLDARWENALDLLAGCQSHIVTCGMGKAGLIAQKIAATLASTGSPAFSLHPADAVHGDMGMIGKGDTALILSNSGESDEIVKLLPYLRQLSVPIVALTADERSTLAAHADVTILLGAIREACPLGLAPTATTTAMLALGDALAVCLMERKGFREPDYARLHPAGALGRKAQPIEAVMRTKEAVAAVKPDTPVSEVIVAITQARSGAAVVVDDNRHVLGIFCDGDLRRGLKDDPEFLSIPVQNAMTANCSRVTTGMVASDVLEQMREKRIAEIPVVDADGCLVGLADMKGILASC